MKIDHECLIELIIVAKIHKLGNIGLHIALSSSLVEGNCLSKYYLKRRSKISLRTIEKVPKVQYSVALGRFCLSNGMWDEYRVKKASC